MGAVLLASTKTALAPDVSVGHLLIQMVVALLIVVGAIWALGKLAGRTRGARRSPKQSTGLQVLSRQSIAKGKSMAVVEVENQRFLVGISGAGFTALGELKGEDATDGEGGHSPELDQMLATALPGRRSLVDALREATVRR